MATTIQHLARRTGRLPPPAAPRTPASSPSNPVQPSFAEWLDARMESGISFSAHAQQRIRQRQIRMAPEDVQQLEQAFFRLEQKGGRDALILREDAAFIVNVPRKKVVTVIDHASLQDRVFSQIDSALLL